MYWPSHLGMVNQSHHIHDFAFWNFFLGFYADALPCTIREPNAHCRSDGALRGCHFFNGILLTAWTGISFDDVRFVFCDLQGASAWTGDAGEIAIGVTFLGRIGIIWHVRFYESSACNIVTRCGDETLY